MNKFEKARFHVDLVEAAHNAVVSVAWSRIRYDSSHFDYDDSESPEWYNNQWLEAHLNESGREYLKMAEEFTKQLDKLL